MLLKKVRVTNYKCILDSAEFSIDQLTCLVGKNESGKSALMQALYKLNPVDPEDKYEELYEYPKSRLTDYGMGDIDNGEIVLTSVWSFTDEEREQIEADFGKGVLQPTSKVVITNGYKNSRHWVIDIDYKVLFQCQMKKFSVNKTDQAHFGNLSSIATVRSSIKRIATPSTNEKQFIDWFNIAFTTDLDSFAEKNFLQYLPKFMYFSEYQKLPGRIAINDYTSKKLNNKLSPDEKVFEALLFLAKTDAKTLQDSNKLEELINRTKGVSSKISKEIFSYWSQNKHLKVDCRFDAGRSNDPIPFNSGYVFSTRIENTRHDSTVSFDDRSTGFVWFFSFLLWFNKLQEEHENLIVLLDEPGLTLHAKAQSDLLRYFKEKILPKFQLIYTTHSPFMLDFSDILSARTVEDVVKDDGTVLGTKVGSEVLSTDRATIFPLQAAFGYDITQTLFVGQNTLLVEGPSDILYLKFFSNLLAKEKRDVLSNKWTICPTGGIDKVQSFVSLFSGNMLNVASLTDYHDGDKTKIEKLRKSGILDDTHILLASDITGLPTSDIEDIIGAKNYIHIINECYGLTEENKIKYNSNMDNGTILQYVKNHMLTIKDGVTDFDHYTPSTFLLENPKILDKMDLTGTLDRFEQLFQRLNTILKLDVTQRPKK